MKTPRETQLLLVFEHVDQDLDTYLKNSPDNGLDENRIQVFIYLHQLFSKSVKHLCFLFKPDD